MGEERRGKGISCESRRESSQEFREHRKKGSELRLGKRAEEGGKFS